MKNNIVAVIAAIALWLIPFCCLLSSCESMRKITTSKKDTTNVSKTDEGFVKSDSSSSRSDKEYERTTYIFPRDTTVINNYYPKSPAPQVIIHEKGRENTEDKNFNQEDFWKSKYDSLNANQETKKVESKTKVINWFQALVIAALVFLLVRPMLPKLKIIRP